MGNESDTQPLSTNQKVIVWINSNLGKKVKTGECWDLAEEALKQAGAHTSSDLGPVTDDADYVWGDKIEIKDVQAGDILQIRDHSATTRTDIDVTFQDGSGYTEWKEETAARGHHTAVANGPVEADGKLKTFEQHVKPAGKVVQNKSLPTRSIGAVTTTTQEKIMNPETKNSEMATVKRTVTVTVSGTIWPYRPKPKP